MRKLIKKQRLEEITFLQVAFHHTGIPDAATNRVIVKSFLSINLQTLLNHFEQEFIWLNMNINVTKSCCIRIGKRYDARCANITTLLGLPLTWMHEFHF